MLARASGGDGGGQWALWGRAKRLRTGSTKADHLRGESSCLPCSEAGSPRREGHSGRKEPFLGGGSHWAPNTELGVTRGKVPYCRILSIFILEKARLQGKRADPWVPGLWWGPAKGQEGITGGGVGWNFCYGSHNHLLKRANVTECKFPSLWPLFEISKLEKKNQWFNKFSRFINCILYNKEFSL